MLTMTSLCTLASLAGPPILCDSLVGERGPWPSFSKSKDLSQAVVQALDGDPDTIDHLRILQAAAIESMDRPKEARWVLAALTTRVLDAEAAGQPAASAWLDAGFFAAAIRYAEVFDEPVGATEGCWGYAWLTRAETLAPADPVFDFALALASQPGAASPGQASLKDRYESHVRAALAAPSADLRACIEAHLARYGTTPEDLTREHASGR